MTIAGHHTVAELKDWLAALDYQAGQVAQAYAAFAPKWRARDDGGAAATDWENDWKALKARYAAAHA